MVRRKDEKQEENLETIQKDVEEVAGKVAHSTKIDRDKALKPTPESVRMREEAGVRCTQVMERRVLKKTSKEGQS